MSFDEQGGEAISGLTKRKAVKKKKTRINRYFVDDNRALESSQGCLNASTG